MDIREAHARERETWNTFVAAKPDGSFLQSWDWGAFQRSLRRKVVTLRITEGDEWLGTALIIRHPLPFRKEYLSIPRGPLLSGAVAGGRKELFKTLLSSVWRHIAQKRSLFVRIDPQWEDNPAERAALEEMGFRKSSAEASPSYTSLLNLGKTDEELLEDMKPKMRSRIHAAERAGVEILYQPAAPRNRRTFDIFWRLLQEDALCAAHEIQGREECRKIIQDGYIAPGGSARPFFEIHTAIKAGRAIAACIVVYFGKRATSLCNVSNIREDPARAASALLYWEAIREARRRGCTEYDFWGVSPPAATDHPQLPASPFKRAFGGIDIGYVGTWDFPIQMKRYWLYRAGEFFRRKA